MDIKIKLDEKNTLNISITARVNPDNYDYIAALDNFLMRNYGDFKKLPPLKKSNEEVLVGFSRTDTMPDDYEIIKEAIERYV